MSALERLKTLKLEDNRGKYPNCPEKALPKPQFTDKDSNGLTRCIIEFLTLEGHQAERVSNTGRRLDQRKKVVNSLGQTQTIGRVKWVKGSGKKGTADISATIAGRAVKIEVKIGKDRLSKDQKQYKAEIEQAGGLYVIARSFQGFFDWYKENFG